MKTNSPSPFFKQSQILGVLLLIALPHALGAQSENPCKPSQDPLDRLKAGNAAFFNDPHFEKVREEVYGKPHRPCAIVLCCSDARVPPELVFGEWRSLGVLFVIRVAGNVVDPAALGSIEYAAQALNAKLLFVLGHEKCGAVEAARAQTSKPLSPNLAWFVAPIKLAVERTKGRSEIETIKENVRVQIENVRSQSSIIRGLEQNGFRIAGGVYYLTGERSGGRVGFF